MYVGADSAGGARKTVMLPRGAQIESVDSAGWMRWMDDGRWVIDVESKVRWGERTPATVVYRLPEANGDS